MKRLMIGSVLCLGLLVGSAFAGEMREFELADGSVIIGEILSFSNGTFTLRTKSLGTLRIQESIIRAIRSRAFAGNKREQIQALQKRMLKDEIDRRRDGGI